MVKDQESKGTLNDLYEEWLVSLETSVWGRQEISVISKLESLGLQVFKALQSGITEESLSAELSKIMIDLVKIGQQQELNSRETAMFAFSFRPFLNRINSTISEERLNQVMDEVGIFGLEAFFDTRENIIHAQRQDLLELSTPIIKLWEGILVLPLIGTLDSKRTQEVMEKLLNAIVTHGSKVIILDITGVSTVDTLVANYILKTAAAVNLLGAKLIITGISPEIAQTMVHLGVDLGNIVTRAVMADGVELALALMKKRIVDHNKE